MAPIFDVADVTLQQAHTCHKLLYLVSRFIGYGKIVVLRAGQGAEPAYQLSLLVRHLCSCTSSGLPDKHHQAS